MVTRQERELSAFLFERYCAALAMPNAKTQDALASALRVAHRRVRQTLEVCFADETVDVVQRRELLTAYGALDASVEVFWRGLANCDPHWVERGSAVIRLVERAHRLAIASGGAAMLPVEPPPGPAGPSVTSPATVHPEVGAPTPAFEDQDTAVFHREDPPPVDQTEVAIIA